MSICINSSTPCILPIAKNTPYFLILPLIFTIAKNYSLVLNFTPYFHEQGVNYSFGKTLARALSRYGLDLKDSEGFRMHGRLHPVDCL